MQERVHLARRIVSLLDLTSLSGSETQGQIDSLCSRAAGPCGQVAAICVFARHLPQVNAGLVLRSVQGVELATVVNFPAGDLDKERSLAEMKTALALGASEVDLVFPYWAYLQGWEEEVREFLEACRQACPVRLKVILESGLLEKEETIRAASRLAVECGADFLKTSTGKAEVHATPEAARTMLEVIAETGGRVGFKASGGIRTMKDALVYLKLAEEILGHGWVSPRTFRFGASSLLDDVLAVAERE